MLLRRAQQRRQQKKSGSDRGREPVCRCCADTETWPLSLRPEDEARGACLQPRVLLPEHRIAAVAKNGRESCTEPSYWHPQGYGMARQTRRVAWGRPTVPHGITVVASPGHRNDESDTHTRRGGLEGPHGIA